MAMSMTQQESTTNAGDKLSLAASSEEQLASGPTLQVHWRGLVHMRGTYPRECLVTLRSSNVSLAVGPIYAKMDLHQVNE